MLLSLRKMSFQTSLPLTAVAAASAAALAAAASVTAMPSMPRSGSCTGTVAVMVVFQYEDSKGAVSAKILRMLK